MQSHSPTRREKFVIIALCILGAALAFIPQQTVTENAPLILIAFGIPFGFYLVLDPSSALVSRPAQPAPPPSAENTDKEPLPKE